MSKLFNLLRRPETQPVEPGRTVLLGSLLYGLWN